MTAAHDGTSATCSIAPICPYYSTNSPNPLNDTDPADVGIVLRPTTTITELRSRCTATAAATSVGAAGPAITVATLLIS